MPRKNPGAKLWPKIPEEMYRIFETLCMDKWPPIQSGKNAVIQTVVAMILMISYVLS